MQVWPFCLQHSKTFEISHAFLWVTIAELSTLKQVRFFGPPYTNAMVRRFIAAYNDVKACCLG